MDYQEQYHRWLREADASLLEELRSMENIPEAIEDAFYRDLAFGTGGLRGVIGAGTNRMNIHTVAKASQGLANYVLKHFSPGKRRIAVSYDSRILSDEFARVSAGVFAANGIQALIYPRLEPTPCLSWAVRALDCAAGVMVTASHNPAKYNGYKVYGPDGCQITTEAAENILAEIEALDIFRDIKSLPFSEGLQNGRISRIEDSVLTGFIDRVKRESLLGDAPADKSARIIYSPLNGTGLEPVTRILAECGYQNITVVEEQRLPDGRFPTCPYPNPEIREAMALGLEYAQRLDADLLLATDPDCDRCGIAVRDRENGYRLLTGNETGLLLLDYICRRRISQDRMPERPVLVKTIVTTDLAQRVADKYRVETVNVLTGFKYIGEVIGKLEEKGEEDRYIFGFEESYGYLSGGYVRDKDAVDAALMICDMFAWYRAQGISLIDRLEQMYREFGYCLNTLHNYTFEGAAGLEKMRSVMAALREPVNSIGGKPVEQVLDYAEGLDGLPKSDVLKFILSGGTSLVVRPSGTEPKLKVYASVQAEKLTDAYALEGSAVHELEQRMGVE